MRMDNLRVPSRSQDGLEGLYYRSPVPLAASVRHAARHALAGL